MILFRWNVEKLIKCYFFKDIENLKNIKNSWSIIPRNNTSWFISLFKFVIYILSILFFEVIVVYYDLFMYFDLGWDKFFKLSWLNKVPFVIIPINAFFYRIKLNYFFLKIYYN